MQTCGEFHKWWYPQMDGLCHVKYHLEMDDDWGSPMTKQKPPNGVYPSDRIQMEAQMDFFQKMPRGFTMQKKQSSSILDGDFPDINPPASLGIPHDELETPGTRTFRLDPIACISCLADFC